MDKADLTWHALKDWTNPQQDSEKLSAHIIKHEGYTDIDPTHPYGGPDGKKDAICKKNGDHWIMAVYFPYGEINFSKIKTKFEIDLKGVKANNASGMAFVTNQTIKESERTELHKLATNLSIETDIFHRDRIVIILDHFEMRHLRLQYLNVTLEPKPWLDPIVELIHEVFYLIPQINCTKTLNDQPLFKQYQIKISSLLVKIGTALNENSECFVLLKEIDAEFTKMITGKQFDSNFARRFDVLIDKLIVEAKK